MDIFEELVFLEMTNKQFRKFPDSRYYELLSNLNEKEKERFYVICGDIHDIWNRINGSYPKVEGQGDLNIDSIDEFNESVKPLDQIILKVSHDFDLSLKREISEQFKESVIKAFGKDFWERTFGEE